MRNCALLLVLVLSFAASVFASPMTYLAELSYIATHDKCPAYDPRIVDSLKKAGLEKGCLSAFKLSPTGQTNELAQHSEDLFFDLAQIELKEQLQCELSKVQALQQNKNNLASIAGDIQKKVPALQELEQEIKKRTTKFQLIYGNLPKNPDAKLSAKDLAKKQEAEKINQEILDLQTQKEFILESIPFAKYSEFANVISSLSPSESANSEKLIQKLESVTQALQKSLSKDLERLQDSVKMDKALPRDLKERIAQEPLFMKHVAEKNKIELTSFEPVRCDIDAKYGSGAVLRDQVGMVVEFAGTGAAVGAVTRSVRTAVRLGTMTRKAGLINLGVKSSLLTLPSAVSAISSECFPSAPNNIIYATGAANCRNEDIERTLKDNNCALAVSLPILAAGLPLLAVGKEVPSLVKDLRITQQAPPTASAPAVAHPPAGVPPKNAVKPKAESTTFEAPEKFIDIPQSPTNHFQEMRNLLRAGDTKGAQAYREKIEKMLARDEMQFVKRIKEGESDPMWVKFPDGTFGVWKPYRLIHRKLAVGDSEIANYKIDQHLGLNRIPVTVERSFRGQRGTVQLVVGNVKPHYFEKYPVETRLFDELISNPDRHPGNYLVTQQGDTAVIDGGASMQGDYISRTVSGGVTKVLQDLEMAERKLGAREIGVERAKALNFLNSLFGEKSTYLKLKNTSEKEWEKILSPELGKKQKEDFFKQRQRVLKAVEEAHRKLGDDVFRAGPASATYKPLAPAKPPTKPIAP